MGRKSVVVLLLCVLACSRGNPVVPGVKQEAVATPQVVAPAAVQNSDVKEMLDTKAPEEVPVVKPVEVAADSKPEPVKQPQEAAAPVEAPSRDARNLGAGNEVNEIGGAENGQSLVTETENVLLQKLNNKCSKRDVSSCVMLKMVTYMNRLLKKSNIEVLDGLHITQTSSEVQVEQIPLDHPRAAADGEDNDETVLSEIIANKLWTFVRTRSIRWSVLPDADVVMSTSPEGEGKLNVGMSFHTPKDVEKGRGKMKNSGGLIAAAAMKFGLLGGLALKGLALLVGKALLVSKIALLLAAILWLKKLFSQDKHVTYEVVAHPHHSHSHISSSEHHGHGGHGGGHGGGDSYSSGWGRSATSDMGAQQLAYRAYVPGAVPH